MSKGGLTCSLSPNKLRISPAKPAPPTVHPILVRDNSVLPDSQVRNLGVLLAASFFDAPHPIHQQILLALPLKYIRNPALLRTSVRLPIPATLSFVVFLGPALHQPPQSILNREQHGPFITFQIMSLPCLKPHSGKSLGSCNDVQ